MKKYSLLIAALIMLGQIFWILSSVDSARPAPEQPAVIPAFALPSLFDSNQILRRADLAGQNIRIVNFFASWCAPCKIEHPLLMELKQRGVSMLGINFQDHPRSARVFLKEKGNPYHFTARDPKGETGRSWRIMSVPQTFVIDEGGRILYHRAGRLHPEDVSNHILPLLETSNRQKSL